MSLVLRTGQPVTIWEFRQKLVDFLSSIDFSAGGIAKLGTGNPFVTAYYVAFRMKWFGLNGNYQHVVAKRDSYGPTTMLFDLSLNNTTGKFQLDTGGGVRDFDVAPPVGRWIHGVYVHDQSPLLRERLYLESQRVSDLAITGQGTGVNALLSFGAAEEGAIEPFNGLLADIVIGTYSPTWKDVVAMQKKHIYKNVWGHWKGNDQSGSVIKDYSKFHRDGTLVGATFNTQDVPMRAR